MEGLKKPVLIVDAFASEANSPSLPLRDLDVQRVLEAMGAMRGLSGDASTALAEAKLQRLINGPRAEFLADKVQFPQWMRSHGFPSPETIKHNLTNLEEVMQFVNDRSPSWANHDSVFVKPASACWQRGAQKVDSVNLRHFLSKAAEPMIVQQYMPTVGGTYGAVRYAQFGPLDGDEVLRFCGIYPIKDNTIFKKHEGYTPFGMMESRARTLIAGMTPLDNEQFPQYADQLIGEIRSKLLEEGVPTNVFSVDIGVLDQRALGEGIPYEDWLKMVTIYETQAVPFPPNIHLIPKMVKLMAPAFKKKIVQQVRELEHEETGFNSLLR